MKLTMPEVIVLGECPTDRNNSLKLIEKAGRICYKSEPQGQPEVFAKKLWTKDHNAMLEHSNVVYRTALRQRNPTTTMQMLKECLDSKFLDFCLVKDQIYIGGNWRAWVECSIPNFAHYDSLPLLNNSVMPSFFPDLELVTKHEEIPYQLKRITVMYKTSRAVTHELVRHRPASFAQESQRWCAYRDELEFIIPAHYMNIESPEAADSNYLDFAEWKKTLTVIEKVYKEFLNHGELPQEARHILPNCTSSLITITTTLSHWRKVIFKLRCAKDADPNMQYVMNITKEIFDKENFV